MKHLTCNEVLAASPTWRPNAPLCEDALASFERELGTRLPDELRAVWLASNGGELHRIAFFDDDLLRELNVFADDRAEHIPDALVFAHDNGDLLFYLAPKNRLGRGAWAVFGVERGAISYEHSFFLAPTLRDFLALAAERGDFFDTPRLEEEWSQAHASEATLLATFSANDLSVELLYFETLLAQKVIPRRDLVIDGRPCMAGQEVHLSRTGCVTYASLAVTTEINQVRCRKGTLIVLTNDGALYRFTPDQDMTFFDVPCAAGQEISLPHEPSGHRTFSATLAAPRVFDGVACREGRVVSFDGARGPLVSATLDADLHVSGEFFPAGTRIERSVADSKWRKW
ncbi:MAG: SMI1/KNR4 family protein [Polyangiaceae bacterium]